MLFGNRSKKLTKKEGNQIVAISVEQTKSFLELGDLVTCKLNRDISSFLVFCPNKQLFVMYKNLQKMNLITLSTAERVKGRTFKRICCVASIYSF